MLRLGPGQSVHRQDLSGAVSLNSVSINGSRVVRPDDDPGLSLLGATTAELLPSHQRGDLPLRDRVFDSAPPWNPRYLSHEAGMPLLTIPGSDWPTLVFSRIPLAQTTFSLISLPYVGLFPAIAKLNFGIAEKSQQSTGSTPRGASAHASARLSPSERCSWSGTSGG